MFGSNKKLFLKNIYFDILADLREVGRVDNFSSVTRCIYIYNYLIDIDIKIILDGFIFR